MSQVVGLPNNSYKPITNTAWVRARLCKLQKGCTRLAVASDKVYQLLAHCRWFSPGTPASSITKTGRHDIAAILLKVALNTKNQINQSFLYLTLLQLYLGIQYYWSWNKATIDGIQFRKFHGDMVRAILLYYILRFYFPYLSLLAQTVNITLYGPGLDCFVFASVPERYLHYYFRYKV